MSNEKEQLYRQLLCEAEQLIDKLCLNHRIENAEEFNMKVLAWKEAKDNI